MKCINDIEFFIDKLDVVEMFYKENREYIKNVLERSLSPLTSVDSYNDEVSVEPYIDDCLSCTFRCCNYGIDNKENECVFESFLKLAIWDLKLFLEDGWTVECKLKFPMVGLAGLRLYELSSKDIEGMSEYLQDLISNDDELRKELREVCEYKNN